MELMQMEMDEENYVADAVIVIPFYFFLACNHY